MNLEPVIGAFIGGVVFALIFKQREQMQEKIGGMAYGFFIPLFFIRVGLRFDIGELLAPEVLLTAGIAILLMVLVRVIGLLPMMFSSLSPLGLAGLPLASAFPLTLLVAIAEFGLESRILTRQDSSAIILTAVVTAIIFPSLLRILLSRFGHHAFIDRPGEEGK